MIIFPLPAELMLCTYYMNDCEYELSNTSRFGFQSTGLGNYDSSDSPFLKSLYKYRDIIHPLLLHLHR
jgi:hypothetical protein